MSAEVSSIQFRAMKGSSEREKSTALITRDLLGGCCSSTNTIGSRELELDSHVPFGWEKRLDLKSGNVYLQRYNSPTTSSDDPICGTMSKQSLNQFAEMSLDLKLVSSSSTSSSSSSANYQSVCTLDKVKSALERAEREKTKKRSPDYSYSYSSHFIKENERDCDEKSSPLTFATGCPNCLLYVLVSGRTPKCPRCNTIIPSPYATKKPRIDLNISI